MIKIALTGYNGWIARSLEKKLKEYEYSVFGIPRQTLYNLVDLDQFFNINHPDFIIHTAAYGNKFDQQNDYETVSANIFSLMNLLEVSKSLDYQGFINISTSSVMLPYDTFYSATKAAGERIVRAFVNKYDKPVVSVRPFTVIGKGENPDHLIPKLIASCMLNINIPFVPDAVHDYIGIDDFTDAILAIMPNIQILRGSSIDIGTGKGTTNKQIKDIVEKVTHKLSTTHDVPMLRPYDNEDWIADTKVLNYLKCKPKQTIKDIITDMIKL
jgi:nucleoside-diphosphate-sugar epimerase